MPRIYLSARGEVVDFDVHMIKQQLATAPMTVDVEKRKSFIDEKEVRKKPAAAVTAAATAAEPTAAPVENIVVPKIVVVDEFEPVDMPKKGK